MYASASGYIDKVPKDVAKKYISESKNVNFKRLREKIFKKKDK